MLIALHLDADFDVLSRYGAAGQFCWRTEFDSLGLQDPSLEVTNAGW